MFLNQFHALNWRFNPLQSGVAAGRKAVHNDFHQDLSEFKFSLCRALVCLQPGVQMIESVSALSSAPSVGSGDWWPVLMMVSAVSVGVVVVGAIVAASERSPWPFAVVGVACLSAWAFADAAFASAKASAAQLAASGPLPLSLLNGIGTAVFVVYVGCAGGLGIITGSGWIES